ncbi:hypothetical protein [Parafrankia discariae]|uniref:hypothetical protein n=1 Tax=Parafrankia discariae TaxID=365528 RepID=UPI00037BAA87|nr:hypothetical protein [Parafrankia discariae]
MVVLPFPENRTVGTVDWLGSSYEDLGPLPARGDVEVPDGGEVTLEVRPASLDWSPIDMHFLDRLPSDSITGMSIMCPVRSGSLSALAHLAPGLRRLTLGWTDLTDEALPHLAVLRHLTWWQSFGNRFSDAGVQQLVALEELDHLYLEESTLTLAGFAFAPRLGRLCRLGVKDASLSKRDLKSLRRRLPGVDVG